MAVTRCVCFHKSFAKLKELATQRGWTRLPEVTEATGCGSGCGGCRPYITAMLETGHTCFAVREPGQDPQACDPDPWDEIND